ncbi:sigma E regulatory protein, MucB/RseB [Desulfolithobacter dissulfuricans]|uniref:Sigma E regulatory protein, MucB/RseB n=1 Tax=Desulfolithobacter dissulfuricans TaxID=2795293 RepID=A0A915UB06_9BACT|nr:outer membrane lipoprotein-sorting protein [Desulfolithobacter dissulfuricans]BCO10160.1 sigma E regulatory protein, MucB/RseB [Desulfolithobacter dissulfuricans]
MQYALMLLTAFSLLLPPAGVRAGDLTDVEEIVNRANLAAYYAGDDGRAEVTMTITDSQGRVRKRQFVILRKDKQDGGEQFFYVYFKKPSDVRKMVFMVHKHIGRDDDRWLYLPALDLVKRIAASDKRTSFVGSNFLYEDVSGRGLEEDVHELVETTDRFYLVKNTPKDPDSVEFSEYTVWIDKQTFMPVKSEYLDKNGQKYRVVEALELRDIQGYPTVIRSRAADLVNGSETVAEFGRIKYNIGLKDRIFTERYLRRPPREVR